MTKLTVIYPAGGGVPPGFHAGLEAIFPGGTILPLTGKPKRGLVGLLSDGYASVNVKDAVLRLDTAEHRLRCGRLLVDTAHRIGGMVVGDLTFERGPFRIVTELDQLVASQFQSLYGLATNGRLIISNAHGYQAFAPGVVPRILPDAMRIVEKVEADTEGMVLKWQFDAAMALSAYVNGVPLTVVPVEAESDRDRPADKVLQQLQMALAVLRGAKALWPEKIF